MKHLTRTLLSTLAIGVVAIAAGAATNAHAAGKLSIYHWFEYIPQELLDKFAEEHDVEVTMDTYDSNEAMLASLKAGKLGSYDVAVPGDYMVEILAQEEMLDTFAPSELRNFGNIEPKWVDVSFDPGRQSSIPYQWGSTSFAVNRNHYPGDINTLALIYDPPAELRGKINVLDTQGEVLTMASIYLGIPQCTSDRGQLKRLNDLVQAAKPHWASFGSDVAKDVLVAEDVSVGMIWSGFASKAREEGAPIEYAFPKEGYVVWMDNVVLLKDAPNRDNAIKFMDFLLEPENAAAVTNFAQYTDGVTGASAFYDENMRNLPEASPPPTPAGSFIQVCTQEVQEVYDEIWTKLRQ